MKIVKQRDLKDCGVCSLASIIEYYNGYVPLEKIRLDTKTSIEGTTALNLIEAGKKYGFDAYGLKLDSIDDEKIILPAIAHLSLKNGYNHFVVIYKISKNKITVMDPAKGKVVMSKDEFEKIWTNVILIFYPSRVITILKSEQTLLTVFLKTIFHEKKLFILIIIISLFLMIFTISSSYYFQVMIEAINLNYFSSYLKIIAVVFGIIIILKLMLAYYRRYLENHLNKNIDCILNINFIKHIFNLPLDVITSRTSGEIITRVNELSSIKSLFTDIVVNCFLDFLLMIASVPLLYKINNKLFLALILCLLLYFIVGLICSKIIYKKAYQNIEYEAEFNNSLLENINMINSIKNLNITQKRLENIDEILSKFLYDNYQFEIFINIQNTIKEWINEIGFFIINTLGFYLIFKNELNITHLITFNALLHLFLDPIRNCIDSLPKYNYLKATFSKINDFLNIEKEKLGEAKVIADNSINIVNLNYSYDKVSNIFKNFNLKIKSGQVICIKGKSGSGKSTLCKIIDNYITDYEGTILIGDVNIRDLSIATIRKNITYVNQKEAILNETIRNNIIINRNIDDEKFYQICKLCCIEEIVAKKMLRYETRISDESNNISGGEKQRIILARALLNEFSILILDEALSEVDYSLERKIIKNIKEYFWDKTILYITHKQQDSMFDKIVNVENSYEC